MSEHRFVVGCMTGTSIDGLDAAMVRIEGRGLGMRAEFVSGIARTLGDLGPRLRAMADQEAMTAGAIAALSREFALAHAAAVRELVRSNSVRRGEPDHPDLIAVHGQTVFHSPPVSWQMFNAAVLAYEIGVPVVTDLRAADLSAGGQGAPITPLADWILFRSARPVAVVNLGGFCNATLLPRGEVESAQCPVLSKEEIGGIRGFDVCACNHLLDRIARDLMGRAYDAEGAVALAGTAHGPARDDLVGILESQSGAGRSLGTGDETGRWVERWATHAAAGDLAATACAAIGKVVATRLDGAEEVLVAGGGARNRALVRAIGAEVGREVRPTDARGVPIEFREAAEIAVLGALCADGVAITLPRVTGVRTPAPVAGVWAGLRGWER